MRIKFGFFENPMEKILANNAQDILKPRTSQQPPDYFYLHFSNDKTKVIETISIVSEGRTLTAHKLQLAENIDTTASSSAKKAIVYMPGNCPFINDSLPTMEPLLKDILTEINKLAVQTNIACYCQHYRGRGENQVNLSENFNDYPLSQDAKDQAALLKKLMDEGYQPENILVIGYSYGSAVGLWALYHLISQYGPAYSNIKFYSDRGFGNLFNFRFVKPFILDQAQAHQKLHEKEMMPDIPLHDIAKRYLPDSFIFYAEDDRCIWTDFSLAHTFTNKEMEGRVWIGNGDHPANSHLADRKFIHLKHLPEIKAHHLMTAIQNEIPIKLNFVCQLPSQNGAVIPGYSLKEGAVHGQDDFIVMPLMDTDKGSNKDQPLSLCITSQAVSHLIESLHQYCLARAKRAMESGLGAAYNHAWLGKTGYVGWTVKDQIQMAIRIMLMLCHQDEPNITSLQSLQHENGPHQSGELSRIMLPINHFIEEYQKLQHLNEWIASMPHRRNERMQNALSAEQESLKKWVLISDDLSENCLDLDLDQDQYRVVSTLNM